MRQNFEFRAVVGILIWIGILAGGIILARQLSSRAPQATTLLAQYIGNQRRIVELEFPSLQWLEVGDPIYDGSTEDVAPIGMIARVGKIDNSVEQDWADKAFILLYGNAPRLSDGDFVVYHTAPYSTAWVLQTMLPPAKRQELTRLIVDSYRNNQADLVAALRPVVEQSLRDASNVIRDDMKRAFESRDQQIRQIGQRYQSNLIEQEIVPLVQNEIWPIVQAEAAPLANEVGREIWSEVSVFRFGWRYLYDKTPLPEQKLAEKEFNRFIDQKAIPILQSYTNEFVDLQKTLIEKLSQNESVRNTVTKSFQTVIQDPEVQDLFNEVFVEVFVNNDRLQGVMEENWNSPQARRAIELANRRLEPTITEIGIALFGSPREQVPPEFARVVRHRILHKDSRWLTLHRSKSRSASQDDSVASPKKLSVRIANTQSVIPYAPARDHN